MTFAKKLQQHQARLGFTDAKMGAALDVGESTFRAWRKGDPLRMPPLISQEGALARLDKLTPSESAVTKS
jgi:hypothetical protein